MAAGSAVVVVVAVVGPPVLLLGSTVAAAAAAAETAAGPSRNRCQRHCQSRRRPAGAGVATKKTSLEFFFFQFVSLSTISSLSYFALLVL